MRLIDYIIRHVKCQVLFPLFIYAIRLRRNNGRAMLAPTMMVYVYLISCSRLLNSSVSKNSARVISKPSHIILIVSSFGFLLFPYKIFFTDDGGRAQMLANLFIDIFLSPQSCKIRFLTADIVFIPISPIILIKIGYKNLLLFIGYVCYY